MRKHSPQARSRRRSVLTMVAICLLGLTTTGCDQRGRTAAIADFHLARTLMIRGEFGAAADKLQDFLDQHPQDAFASRATFLLAKSELGRGNLDASQQWFERTIEQFPDSEEAHKARFKLAVIELLRENHAEARRQFDALAQRRDGPYTPEATAYSHYLTARDEAGHLKDAGAQ